MFLSKFLLLMIYIPVCSSLKQDEKGKSLAEILKMVNENPGVEIRVEFDEIVDEKLTGAADNKSSSEILDEMNAGSLLVKELHEASGKILGKLNKTTNKLDMIIKCLSTLEKIFREVSAKTKEGEESIPLLHPPLHHQTLNQTEEIEEGGGHDDIILDLLMG